MEFLEFGRMLSGIFDLLRKEFNLKDSNMGDTGKRRLLSAPAPGLPGRNIYIYPATSS